MSQRVKQALAGAIAMVIAIGLAMAWDWERPYWAALGIAVCTQLSDGETLQKALLRLAGTVLGALTLLVGTALFAQDRFPALLFAAAVVLVYGYLMSSVRRFYFFYLAAFVPVLIATMDRSDPDRFFQLVTARLQETGLGVGVYVLVALLLFPTPGRVGFFRSLGEQVRTLSTLVAGLTGAGLGRGEAGGRMSSVTAAQQQGALPAAMDAAELDSLDVFENRGHWRRSIAALGQAVGEADRARLELERLEGVDTARTLPGLAAFGAEIAARLGAVRTMIDGGRPGHAPASVGIAIDRAAEAGLDAFQVAALRALHARLVAIEGESRALFHAVARARQVETRGAPVPARPRPVYTIIPDPERAMGTLRVVLGFWACYAAYMFIWGLPMSALVLVLSVSGGLMLAMVLPQVRPMVVMLPIAVVILCCMFIHVLWMPMLNGYTQLALFMIFPSVFAVLYFTDGVAKGLALGVWASTTQLSGDVQSYSFTYFTDALTGIFIALCMLQIFWQFPVSFTPQAAFERQLRRFLQSAGRVIESLHPQARAGETWWQRQLRIHHQKQIATLPQRLAACARALPAETVGAETIEHAGALSGALAVLGKRLEDLVALGRDAEVPAADLEALRRALAEIAAASGPRAGETALSSDFAGGLARIEAQVADASDAAQADRLYPVLGAYRGLSEAVVAAAEAARRLDLGRLREPRFNV